MQFRLGRAATAALISFAATGFALTAGAASAAASPCEGGTYVEITSHSTVYHAVYGPFHDDNGTTSPAPASFSNTYKGSVESKVDASAEVSVGTALAQAKASVSKSVTKSQSVSIGHKITYSIPAHKSLHVEYAVVWRKVHIHKYSDNKACHVYDSHWGYAYLDDGVGWHSWLTAYGS